jgi:hypothetical protein
MIPLDPEETCRGHMANSLITLQEAITSHRAFWLHGTRVVTVSMEDLTRVRDRIQVVRERHMELWGYMKRLDDNTIFVQTFKNVAKQFKF